MKYFLLTLFATAMLSCTGAGDGGYNETKGTNEIDRTDTLNRETPYNTPGSSEGSQPGE